MDEEENLLEDEKPGVTPNSGGTGATLDKKLIPAAPGTVPSALSPSVVTRIGKAKQKPSGSIVSQGWAAAKDGHSDAVYYPPKPETKDDRKYLTCNICGDPLEESALTQAAWEQHVEKDLEPYVCISEECREPPVFFVHGRDWLSHMQVRHSMTWAEKVHTEQWYCDIDHDEPLIFDEKEPFVTHLRTDHGDKLTRSKLDGRARRNRRIATRERFVCPLCECMPESEEPHSHESLARHIALHLKALAFLSLSYVDDGSGDVGSTYEAQKSNAKDESRISQTPIRERNTVEMDDIPETEVVEDGRRRVGSEVLDEPESSDFISLEVAQPIFDNPKTQTQERRNEEDNIKVKGATDEKDESGTHGGGTDDQPKKGTEDKPTTTVEQTRRSPDEKTESSGDVKPKTGPDEPPKRRAEQKHETRADQRPKASTDKMDGTITFLTQSGAIFVRRVDDELESQLPFMEQWYFGAEPETDICFVHGHQGSPKETWPCPGYSTPWPRKLLGPKLTNVRLLMYGYPRSRSLTPRDVGSWARDLMKLLRKCRRKAKTRPLIFIAHGTGGWVCMDILRRMPSVVHNPLYEEMSFSIRGMLFIGTPNMARPADSIYEAPEPGSVDDWFRRDHEGFLRTILSRRFQGKDIEIACLHAEGGSKTTTFEGYDSFEVMGIGKTSFEVPTNSISRLNKLLETFNRWKSGFGSSGAGASDTGECGLQQSHPEGLEEEEEVVVEPQDGIYQDNTFAAYQSGGYSDDETDDSEGEHMDERNDPEERPDTYNEDLRTFEEEMGALFEVRASGEGRDLGYNEQLRAYEEQMRAYGGDMDA